MKCPKCGCKIHKQIMCPYCKITGDEVRFASNKEAKKRLKNKNNDEVLMSSYIPFDVDKRKLAAITIIGGFFGFDAYYLGRYKYGVIKLAIIFLTFICFTLDKFLGFSFLNPLTDILTIICAFFLVGWIANIVNILFNKATVPVVLPNKKELEQRIDQRNKELEEKQRRKEEKAQQKFNKQVNKMKKKMDKENKDKNDKQK